MTSTARTARTARPTTEAADLSPEAEAARARELAEECVRIVEADPEHALGRMTALTHTARNGLVTLGEHVLGAVGKSTERTARWCALDPEAELILGTGAAEDRTYRTRTEAAAALVELHYWRAVEECGYQAELRRAHERAQHAAERVAAAVELGTDPERVEELRTVAAAEADAAAPGWNDSTVQYRGTAAGCRISAEDMLAHPVEIARTLQRAYACELLALPYKPGRTDPHRPHPTTEAEALAELATLAHIGDERTAAAAERILARLLPAADVVGLATAAERLLGAAEELAAAEALAEDARYTHAEHVEALRAEAELARHAAASARIGAALSAPLTA